MEVDPLQPGKTSLQNGFLEIWKYDLEENKVIRWAERMVSHLFRDLQRMGICRCDP
jgi:hypothetical protein